MYREFQPKRPYSDTLNSWPQESCRLYEPHISDREYYTEELLDHARDYSDTAIAVIGRFAGESNDCPKVQYKLSLIHIYGWKKSEWPLLGSVQWEKNMRK